MSKATNRAVKLLQQGKSMAYIHQSTGLSFDTVEAIRESLNKQHLLGETRDPAW